jgi:hypothetical protein
LKDHVEEHIQSYGLTPESLTADAGYGSEENYTFLEEQGVTAFVKYNYFDREQKEKKPNPFHADNLHYDAGRDTLTCPIGQEMSYIGDKRRRTAGGFIQIHRMYQARVTKPKAIGSFSDRPNFTGTDNASASC